MIGSQQPLARRLTAMNLLVSVTVLFIALLAFFAYDIWSFRTNLIRNLDTQALIIGSNSVTALVFDDPQTATQTLSAFRASPYIVSAAILKPDGSVFATYHRENATFVAIPTLDPSTSERHWTERSRVYVLEAISLDGKRQGEVFLEYNTQLLTDRIIRFLLFSLVTIAGCLLAAMLVARYFRSSVVAPIEVLADTARIVSKERDYSLRVAPQESGPEISSLIRAFNDMLSQIQARDAALGKARDELEARVQDRTKQLVAINRELEAFSYTVSHDLRGPLDVLNGYAHILKVEAGSKLGLSELECIDQIQASVGRMGELIEDLLNLSRVSGTQMHFEPVDLTAIAQSVVDQLRATSPERRVDFTVGACPPARADARLLRIVLENLLRNAWKYTSGHATAHIEFGCDRGVYFVRDDGAGFDGAHADRLFKPFQRLHSKSEFPGTGIGLATVQRIIHRHGGEVWAVGAPERGATFYFRLGT